MQARRSILLLTKLPVGGIILKVGRVVEALLALSPERDSIYFLRDGRLLSKRRSASKTKKARASTERGMKEERERTERILSVCACVQRVFSPCPSLLAQGRKSHKLLKAKKEPGLLALSKSFVGGHYRLKRKPG